MPKPLVNIDIPQDDVYRLLSALKLAEIKYGDMQMWDASLYINKLYDSLKKQIFEYEREDDGSIA